ncbi:hypothetical protein OF83DRAFT_1159672 [Amylostereum chailletii]|nr:hypothetical protein OF83DRAFT_1159672 [Amylostereum chailletii]
MSFWYRDDRGVCRMVRRWRESEGRVERGDPSMRWVQPPTLSPFLLPHVWAGRLGGARTPTVRCVGGCRLAVASGGRVCSAVSILYGRFGSVTEESLPTRDTRPVCCDGRPLDGCARCGG